MSSQPAAAASEPRAEGRIRKCDTCSAPVEFDPKSAQIRCTYCAAAWPAVRPGEVVRHPFAQMDSLPPVAPREGEKIVSCGNCGATASVGRADAALRCIYCLSALTVSTGAQPLAEVDGVVPFALTREEAKDRFAAWLKGLWFAPNELTRMAKLTGLRAIYVPAWVFASHVDARWSAHVGFLTSAADDAKARRPRPPGDPGHVRTRWEDLTGTRAADYTELVATASHGLTSKEIRSIEPFALGEALAPFDEALLAGFDAELPGIAAKDGWKEARERLQVLEESECEELVPGDEHKRFKVQLFTSQERFLLALLPVFVVAYAYRGEVYRVLVNGKTGAVEGDQPLSAWKVGFLLAVIAVIVLGILAVLA